VVLNLNLGRKEKIQETGKEGKRYPGRGSRNDLTERGSLPSAVLRKGGDTFEVPVSRM